MSNFVKANDLLYPIVVRSALQSAVQSKRNRKSNSKSRADVSTCKSIVYHHYSKFNLLVAMDDMLLFIAVLVVKLWQLK